MVSFFPFFNFLRFQCIFSTSAVSLTSNPVDSNALHPANAVGHHVLPPGLVSLSPADGTEAHVHPVDCIIFWEEKKNNEMAKTTKRSFCTLTRAAKLLWKIKVLPAWKSMPTAKEVPDTGTNASDLSAGSKGMPRMPSCTEYSRKEPTPAQEKSSMFHDCFA